MLQEHFPNRPLWEIHLIIHLKPNFLRAFRILGVWVFAVDVCGGRELLIALETHRKISPRGK